MKQKLNIFYGNDISTKYFNKILTIHVRGWFLWKQKGKS